MPYSMEWFTIYVLVKVTQTRYQDNARVFDWDKEQPALTSVKIWAFFELCVKSEV